MNLNPLHALKDKKHAQVKNHPARKDAIKQSYLIKLGILESKYPFFLSLDKLSSLLQEFFKQYYHIHYEFTLNELSKELGKKSMAPELKVLVNDFFEKLEEIKYSYREAKPNEEAVLRLAAEAKFIIEKIE